jgi:dimethylamine monooxygenase subunit A
MRGESRSRALPLRLGITVHCTLPSPPFYFPLRHGRYDVAPGLNRFGKELGGGDADAKLFQFDDTFWQFRNEKLAARAVSFDRYACVADLSHDTLAEVSRFVLERLEAEHPTLFLAEQDRTGTRLHCALTRETIDFDHELDLAGGPYANALDALACQVQEDLAIVRTSGERHWLSAAHVCLPNGWSPAEKVGCSFAGIHEPVAGMAEMNRRGEEFARIMVGATDGLVRFAWGVTFDDRLNHHPALPRTPFDPAGPRAFLRVERQTIWGFPARGAALFTIRTYLYDCEDIRRDPSTREPLVAALKSMPDASRVYKGLGNHADGLIAWLESGW